MWLSVSSIECAFVFLMNVIITMELVFGWLKTLAAAFMSLNHHPQNTSLIQLLRNV